MAATSRDFAALLDDLMAADRELDERAKPSVQFDYLAVAEELGKIKLSEEAVTAEYAASKGLEAELDAIFAAAGKPVSTAKPAAELAGKPAADEGPSIDPGEISRELGLGKKRSVDELARLRRAFAFKNHPDRAPTHLRQRAMLRMQVANQLIDEARARAGA
jgi:hypothetical protein